MRTPVTGGSLKEFIYELDRIGNERVSEKEIADAKSYLTGVFPIRLETQEGLTDQLVQIKMLNMPSDYLEHYRDRVQAVTAEENPARCAEVSKPDAAALIVVGDGASVLEQIKPYVEDIEGTTPQASKNRNTLPARRILSVSWSIEVETPLDKTFRRR